MSLTPDVLTGGDGLPRCGWVGDDQEYRRYHDEEWGFALHGDRALFEKLSLEAFQSGLSWITILRRREGFRRAFAGFDPTAVASFDEEDVARLLDDASIIRNRSKVEATIANARLLVTRIAHEPGGLDGLVWRHAPEPRAQRPRRLAELPATTAESSALSRALKSVGWRFVGPTTAYALMQSAGLVDDHLAGCWRASP
ncbi:MAG: DNA-3-methyladenine glycosylase I [Microcella sp.]|uniref:DNA-3-methyladenine glycosylase I n=1 Tax=Microcella sp. TaxID=1913979 RepID=UPI0033157665